MDEFQEVQEDAHAFGQLFEIVWKRVMLVQQIASQPHLKDLKKIAKILDVDIRELLVSTN